MKKRKEKRQVHILLVVTSWSKIRILTLLGIQLLLVSDLVLVSFGLVFGLGGFVNDRPLTHQIETLFVETVARIHFIGKPVKNKSYVKLENNK